MLCPKSRVSSLHSWQTFGRRSLSTCDSFRTPLHLAALCGNTDYLSILLQNAEMQKHLDDSDRWLDSPLAIACGNRNIGYGLALVENGAVPQRKPRTMIQPLFFAAIEPNNLAAAKVLKDHDADLSTEDLIGLRPMELAEDVKAKGVLKYLNVKPTTLTHPARRVFDITDTSLDSALRYAYWHLGIHLSKGLGCGQMTMEDTGDTQGTQNAVE